MKAVMISIRTQWCELIASGKKSVEIRKTRPKLETPFKCYIYCTQGSNHLCLMQNPDGVNLIACCNWKTALPFGGSISNGKVIGEFVCNGIAAFQCSAYAAEFGDEYDWSITNDELKQSCLTFKQLDEYGLETKNGRLYGWHISGLQIYDKPKELSEFGLARPFQSWGYVNGKAD